MSDFNIWGRNMTLAQCGKCGIEWAHPSKFDRECQVAGPDRTFYCPNGHPRVYSESALTKAQRERDIAKQQLARAEDEVAEARRRADLAERKTARVTKRAHAGVCQCCNRSFANVARHMKSKHPNVVPIKKGNAA